MVTVVLLMLLTMIIIRFEVEVVDDRGSEVWRARGGATRVEAPAGVLAPGRSYTWRVTAQGQGERRLESAPQTFVVVPR